MASNSARCARPSPSPPRPCVAPAGLCRVLRKKGFASCRVGPPPAHNPHSSPCSPKDPQPGNYWCEHAGVLIFAALLGAISKVSGNPQDILAQWLAALWLGAANIEQTKFLHWEDLELILGPGVRYPTQQREKLQALAADPQLIQTLLGQSALVGRRRGHGPLLRSPRQARHRRADCVGGLVKHR